MNDILGARASSPASFHEPMPGARASSPASFHEPGPDCFPGVNGISHYSDKWHSRGYHIHFDGDKIIQFVTFRLYDSVPLEILEDWRMKLNIIGDCTVNYMAAATLRRNIEKYEDSGKGACYLKDARIASIVQDAFLYNDGAVYRLLEWCIMPNHVHVLIEVIDGRSLSEIVQGWKSYTAHESNKTLNRKGLFWMADYFDRYIRDEKHYNRTVEYIRYNPVKAGMVKLPEDWEWSSAGFGRMMGSRTVAGGDARVPGTENN